MWLKVILHASSLSDERGNEYSKKDEAEEGEGGSRADRQAAVQAHSSLFTSDMMGKVWNKTKRISRVRKIVYFYVKEIDTSS